MRIKESVKLFLSSNPVYSGVIPENLEDDYPLIDSGILDSIGIYSLVVYLEKEFSIKVEITDLVESNLGTLSMIEAFVKEKKIA